MNKATFTTFFLALFAFSLNAQNNPPAPVPDHSYKPLTLKLNEDGSKYVRFIMWHQFWLTNTANNPGTVDVNGKEISSTTDFSLRRSRLLWYAQISPRFLILSHIGINNQSFVGGGANGQGATGTDGKKPQLFVHDAWTEYQLVKDKLYIGGGLHYWNGVSRMASASTLNFMALDAPVFNWYNIEQSDQFARQLGIYAKGQIKKFDYRISINKPFVTGKAAVLPAGPIEVSNTAALASYMGVNKGVAEPIKSEAWATQGYIAYQFWNTESNKLPFYVGTHLGAKKVLNLGVGWYSHPDIMGTMSATVDTAGNDTYTNFAITKYAQKHVGVDVYLDMPIGKGKKSVLHAYALYQKMDFGPNYVRNIGILNLHSAVAAGKGTFNGGGNAQPTLGTGSIFYTQLGYAFAKFKNGHQVMPYINTTTKKFDGLDKSSTQFDLGLNYFIAGHNAKITAQYSTRPVYKSDKTYDSSKSQFTVQTHIFL